MMGQQVSRSPERGLLGRIRPSAESVLRSAASEPMRLDCRSLSSSRVAKFLESESADAWSQRKGMCQHASSCKASSLRAAQHPLS